MKFKNFSYKLTLHYFHQPLISQRNYSEIHKSIVLRIWLSIVLLHHPPFFKTTEDLFWPQTTTELMCVFHDPENHNYIFKILDMLSLTAFYCPSKHVLSKPYTLVFWQCFTQRDYSCTNLKPIGVFKMIHTDHLHTANMKYSWLIF